MKVRMVSIDPETGRKDGGAQVPGERDAAMSTSGADTPAPTTSALLQAQRKSLGMTRIQEMIEKALAGQLPRDRDPHYWEPDKLSAPHIAMVLDRAAGYSIREIAERHEYTESRVSIILSTPDAQTILSTIMAVASERIIDVSERLKYLAPEALNVKVDIMRNATSMTLRDKAATDILDRAGYGARTKIDATVSHSLVMPAQAATGLAAALSEANRVGDLDYSTHLAKPLAAEAMASSLMLGTGHSEASEVSPPSPSASGLALLREKIA